MPELSVESLPIDVLRDLLQHVGVEAVEEIELGEVLFAKTRQISDAFGWPYLAMASGFDARVADSAKLMKARMRGLEVAPIVVDFSGRIDGRALPLQPIWLGFALDTVFYALLSSLLWWAFARGPSDFLRFIRRKRGLCPACGYRVGDSPVCTECGKAVPRGSVLH